MSSLQEKFGEDANLNNISPFSFKEGLTVKESDDSFPNVGRLQSMLLKEGAITKRHLYIIQFIYEMGFMTQKQIEWAMNGCTAVDPYVKNMASVKPYDSDVRTLLNLRVIRKGEVLNSGKKQVRYYRLTPATEEWYKSCVSFDKTSFYSDPCVPRPSRMTNMTPERILGELAATDLALRMVIYSSDGLEKKNRFYLENGNFLFSGKYTFKNGLHLLALPVRRMEDYGRVLDALKLPNFAYPDYKLVAVCDNVASFGMSLYGRLKDGGLLCDDALCFVDDTSLRNLQRPTVYKFYDTTARVFEGFWE